MIEVLVKMIVCAILGVSESVIKRVKLMIFRY